MDAEFRRAIWKTVLCLVVAVAIDHHWWGTAAMSAMLWYTAIKVEES